MSTQFIVLWLDILIDMYSINVGLARDLST